MPETGLRVDVIGFLSPINVLAYSIIAVTDSGGSHAKGSIGAFPSSGPLWGGGFSKGGYTRLPDLLI